LAADEADLVNQPDDPQEFEPVFMGGNYVTRVAIPRGGKVQKIAAWKSYRIVNQVLSRSVEDHGTALLAPLREWLKKNIPDQNAAPTTNPPNPRCSPEGQ